MDLYVFVITMAVSDRDISFIKAVLLSGEHYFCVAWLNMPSPIMIRDHLERIHIHLLNSNLAHLSGVSGGQSFSRGGAAHGDV